MSGSSCRDCPATIAWAKTTKGRAIPLEGERGADGKVVPVEFPDGNVEPTGAQTWGRDGRLVPVVKIVRSDSVSLPGVRVLWRSHFASCPKASENRRRRSGRGSTGRGSMRDDR